MKIVKRLQKKGTAICKKVFKSLPKFVQHALGAIWQESYGEQFDYANDICKEVKSVLKHKFIATILLWVLRLYVVSMFVLSFTPFNIPVLNDVSTCLNFVQRLVKDWAVDRYQRQQKKRRRNKRRKSDRRRPIR